MIEKYLGKNVRILVSSDSGVGVSCSTHIGSIESAINSVIIVFGIINDIDDKFIEIKNSRMIYLEPLQSGSRGLGGKELNLNNVESEITIVNLSKIITISIV
jgi:hypothetical protein